MLPSEYDLERHGGTFIVHVENERIELEVEDPEAFVRGVGVGTSLGERIRSLNCSD